MNLLEIINKNWFFNEKLLKQSWNYRIYWMFMILNEFYIDLNLLKKSELLSWLNFYRILNRFNQLENRKLMILLEIF